MRKRILIRWLSPSFSQKIKMLILASASPRRKKLMREKITTDFMIVTPDIDESISMQKYRRPSQIVMDIAKRKCLKVAEKYEDDIVIAADTVVVINEQIIGKPKDKEDAERMLHLLSNNKHEVYTGYAIKKEDKIINKFVKSIVYFNDLSDELIASYIATGSPLDKAGAYGYQDQDDFALVKKISGSIDNVIGFPTDEIKADLIREFNF